MRRRWPIKPVERTHPATQEAQQTCQHVSMAPSSFPNILAYLWACHVPTFPCWVALWEGPTHLASCASLTVREEDCWLF